ncbi:MAG: methyl-accepting chemotaxis protein [Desulfarculaceae bacterium]|nr:methyl-accepting chemotaxis protein [Desulfarculaceae bacterium]
MSVKLGSSIKFKLVILVIVVFALSFLGIIFSVIQVQQAVSEDMKTGISTTLKKTGDRSDKLLTEMSASVNTLLVDMKKQAVNDLSESTAKEMGRMERRIKKGMERLLLSEASAVTDLLKSVAPAIIMSEDFTDLVKYSKAASKTQAILFALFIKEDGTPYPGYVDPSNPKIKEFLQNGKGETGIEKILNASILNASKQSPDVLLNKSRMEYFGKPVGSIVVCINRAGIQKEIKKLSADFQNQIQENRRRIQEVLTRRSAAVTDQIETNISSVSRESLKGMEKANAIVAGSVNLQKRKILSRTAIVSAVALVFSMVILWIFLVKMLRPLSRCADFAAEIGSGNLTASMDRTSSDEIGVTARAMGSMAEKLRQLMKKLAETSSTIFDSSARLTDISTTLAESSSKMQEFSRDATRETSSTSENIKNISSASEEINAQIDTIAATSNGVSNNVMEVGEKIKEISKETTSVSSAIEEMYASLNEVADNSNKAASITDQASDQAAVTSDIVHKLGDSARDIEKVISLISGIASQTNLLALNAAIEAAGAGEAGKGFAVVANEVKELANQTSKATVEIREEIAQMQTNTQNAVDAIGSIVKVIEEINGIMGTIASAVEEQTATVNEISKNISSTAGSAEELTAGADETVKAVKEIASTLEEVSKGSDQIAKDVAMASQATEKVLTCTTQTDKAVNDSAGGIKEIGSQAEDLASLSRGLKEIISRFTV